GAIKEAPTRVRGLRLLVQRIPVPRTIMGLMWDIGASICRSCIGSGRKVRNAFAFPYCSQGPHHQEGKAQHSRVLVLQRGKKSNFCRAQLDEELSGSRRNTNRLEDAGELVHDRALRSCEGTESSLGGIESSLDGT